MNMMQTTGIIDLVTPLAIILAGIIAACGAIKAAKVGISGWREEMYGKAKFEIAREAIKLAYEARHCFKSARSAVSSSEAAGRDRKLSEADGEAKLLDEQFARMRRMDKLATVLIRMRAIVWESRVLFGHHHEGKMHELSTQYEDGFSKLSSAIIAYYNVKIKIEFQEWILSDADKVSFEKYQSIVYFMPDDKSPGTPIYSGTDAFSDEIEGLTQQWVSMFGEVARGDWRQD